MNSIYSNIGTPIKVVNAFKKTFPKSTDINWIRLEHDQYLVEFINFTHVCRAIFDQSGLWHKTVIYLMEDELPNRVCNVLNTKFTKVRINNAQFHQVASERDYYYLEVEDSDKYYTLLITTKGEINSYTSDALMHLPSAKSLEEI